MHKRHKRQNRTTQNKEKRPSKYILIREEYCMGCRLCEVHCLVQHSHTKNIIKAYKEESQRSIPGVIIEEYEHSSFALQCRHCEDAPCLDACISGAMYRDEETGAVLNTQDVCIGCWMCIMVCPFGAILRNTQDKKIISKCDLCFGEEEPVCVKNCPNEAIVCEGRD